MRPSAPPFMRRPNKRKKTRCPRGHISIIIMEISSCKMETLFCKFCLYQIQPEARCVIFCFELLLFLLAPLTFAVSFCIIKFQNRGCPVFFSCDVKMVCLLNVKRIKPKQIWSHLFFILRDVLKQTAIATKNICTILYIVILRDTI